jgi:hypothetical protein
MLFLGQKNREFFVCLNEICLNFANFLRKHSPNFQYHKIEKNFLKLLLT